MLSVEQQNVNTFPRRSYRCPSSPAGSLIQSAHQRTTPLGVTAWVRETLKRECVPSSSCSYFTGQSSSCLWTSRVGRSSRSHRRPPDDDRRPGKHTGWIQRGNLSNGTNVSSWDVFVQTEGTQLEQVVQSPSLYVLTLLITGRIWSSSWCWSTWNSHSSRSIRRR